MKLRLLPVRQLTRQSRQVIHYFLFNPTPPLFLFSFHSSPPKTIFHLLSSLSYCFSRTFLFLRILCLPFPSSSSFHFFASLLPQLHLSPHFLSLALISLPSQFCVFPLYLSLSSISCRLPFLVSTLSFASLLPQLHHSSIPPPTPPSPQLHYPLPYPNINKRTNISIVSSITCFNHLSEKRKTDCVSCLDVDGLGGGGWMVKVTADEFQEWRGRDQS